MNNTIIDLDDLNDTIDNGKFLYHYTSTKTAIEKIFPTNSLKFNSLNKMNDPLEYENFLYNYDKHNTNAVFETSVELNNIIKNHFKICCFCKNKEPENTNSFPQGFLRSRMWTQYAEKHTGICLVFNNELLYENMIGNIKSIKVKQGSIVSIYHAPIKYDDLLKGLDEALSLKINMRKDYFIKKHIEQYINAFLFMKLMDYRDESEYRYGIYSEDFIQSSEIFVSFGNALEAIILGNNFCSEYLENIFKASNFYSVPVFSLSWINGKPSLDRTKVYPKGTLKQDIPFF